MSRVIERDLDAPQPKRYRSSTTYALQAQAHRPTAYRYRSNTTARPSRRPSRHRPRTSSMQFCHTALLVLWERMLA